jgi:hypothetical protein
MGIWVPPYDIHHYMCRWGWISGKKRYDQACMMLWCHGNGRSCKPPLTASHIHIRWIKSVLVPWDTVDGLMVHPYAVHHYMCRWGWDLGNMGYCRACMRLWCHCRGWKPPLTAPHIHIGCIQSVLAPWDAVDGRMGASLWAPGALVFYLLMEFFDDSFKNSTSTQRPNFDVF